MKESKEVYFSVLIANYNRNLKCLRAVNSVLNQSYPFFECIVLDDASTDDSIDILKSIKDPRFRLVMNKKNCGQANLFNNNIPNCKYDWIAFLDSDDFWHKDRLLNQVDQIRNYGNTYGLYYCSSTIFYSDNSMRIIPAKYDGYIYEEMKFRNLVGVTSRVIVNKKLYIQVGGFDSSLPACKDWDCWLRISRDSKVKSLNIPLVFYEESIDSVSSDLDKIKIGRYKFWRKTFGNNLTSNIESNLRLEFSKFLLSRGFQREAVVQSFEAFKLKKSLKSILFVIAAILPPQLIRNIYSFSKLRFD